MKVRIPKECLAFLMFLMGLVFVFAICDQGSIIIGGIVGGICLVFVICGVYIHLTVIQEGDYADYDVIG